MNKNNIFSVGIQRKSRAGKLLVCGAFIATSASAAFAQIALPGSDLVLPASAAPTADMVILKTEAAGGFDAFKIMVTNSGSVSVTGAAVTDNGGTNGLCLNSNPVTITGSGVPEGSFTIANLNGAGIALGTLESGQVATISYSCRGK